MNTDKNGIGAITSPEPATKRSKDPEFAICEELLCEAIESQVQIIRLAYEAIRRITSTAGSIPDDFEKKQALECLYWCYPQISTDALVKAFGYKSIEAMEEDIPPWTADDDCDKCGKPKIYKKRWEMAERRCKNCEQTWDAQEKQQMERGQVASIELANKKIRELRALPYKDYLQTDHWKSIKTAILQTYGFRCQICNGDGPLHVHHRTYERLGAEDSKDLTVLCKSCHEKFHGVTA